MVGFGLPFKQPQITHRNLPEAATGPPFFYYENVALAPQGVWETISWFLYNIEPEFIDSKFFCAAARKRGYIHNLPIKNRFPLLPIPPKTIYEVFPSTKKGWPSWDTRTQLNCLQTGSASAKLTERIRFALAQSGDRPYETVIKWVNCECCKWNLLWIGLHKVAPLEPDEIETLLGFPRNHTRGISRKKEIQVCRKLLPSWFCSLRPFGLERYVSEWNYGIGTILGDWGCWNGSLSAWNSSEDCSFSWVIRDQQKCGKEVGGSRRVKWGTWSTFLMYNSLMVIVSSIWSTHIGGFDLVIGGSPCYNLAGSNRYHRDGLEGEHSPFSMIIFRSWTMSSV